MIALECANRGRIGNYVHGDMVEAIKNIIDPQVSIKQFTLIEDSLVLEMKPKEFQLIKEQICKGEKALRMDKIAWSNIQDFIILQGEPAT